jgi:hypothetical protein
MIFKTDKIYMYLQKDILMSQLNSKLITFFIYVGKYYLITCLLLLFFI